ncbi:MAG: HEAT repeat domain-containing protein [cyanobacterium endosymbiont of Rhopalodia musculus]|uniref:HEAT repeat domain-containing protein n=1 Tax=cyanobacterium endosymbiont of Epithemia clementina EcSB TaxID=3034674 RepID=UPI0024805964|nr:HEAT repeat domain-containing protein [cyanobacterium endosymbiont of Epithemia clementina EcSB]WGT67847.1 HEAT repeat domain-containing protein [cyanobacterium endosymbiont of Epithemia clementina EcSB]
MHDDDLSVIETADQLGEPLDFLDFARSELPPPNPELILPLLTDPDPSQRMLAARVFCELQDQRAIAPLIDLLNDICPLVRVSAAYALGRNTSPDAIGALIELLQQDWNGYVRKGIVWALGNGGDRRALNPLIHAVKTDISAVRLWAASSLARIAKLEYEDVIATIAPLVEGLRQDCVAAVRGNCAWAIGQLCREIPSNIVYATAIDALIKALAEDEDLGVKDDARNALLKVGDPRGLQMIEELELEGLI